MMMTDQISVMLMGYPIEIMYYQHERNYIQWSLVDKGDDPHLCMLETLLRVHYSDYVEAQIREEIFYKQYTEAVGAMVEEQLNQGTLYEDIPF